MNQQIFNLKTDEKPLDNIKENCGFAAIFKDIGVIGDSLSSGEFEATDENGQITYHDFYEYSWPAILQRITGTNYSNYSRGGMSLKEFYESWADKNNFWQKKQAYIIDLGNNDIYFYHQQIGTAEDIHPDNPDLNPDTYFGYLGKVISKLKSLEKDSCILLVSMQRHVAKEMETVTKLFTNAFLIDMTTYGPAYDEETREKYAMGFHPNAMGYYIYALMIGNYIDYIIRRNYKDFFKLPFIGTGLDNRNY